MIPPDFPPNELVRVSLLTGLDILDTGPDERFDRLTRIAQRLFAVPIALVSFVESDRQRFKSCVGLDLDETPRDISFCGHAILRDDILLVPDTTLDPRFSGNPMVTGGPRIRFYAGFPLSLADGIRVGTLCLKDTVPRHFSEHDMQLLRDLGTIAQQELRAVAAATTDDLTGLLNRRGFLSLARKTLEICRRTRSPSAILYADLNDFKAINDRFGHAEGDHALKAFADVLKSTFRSADLIARLGGDEFAVLLSNADPANSAAAIERVKKELAASARLAGRPYTLSCSIGSAVFGSGAVPDIETMLSVSDEKMYQIKARERQHRQAASP